MKRGKKYVEAANKLEKGNFVCGDGGSINYFVFMFKKG